MQLTIDTQTDTYEQAIAAVQAAYGLNPAAVASSWPDAPAAVPRPGPETLSGEDLGQGWTERMLFDTVAAVVPGARAVLRRLVEVDGIASYGPLVAAARVSRQLTPSRYVRGVPHAALHRAHRVMGPGAGNARAV
ncbi:hypothetical protein ABZU45_38535 [Streptomyces avermitilis]|uniref:hypothetical protein n=1 Tax=Streptomyces avermitilis TaxID=33903 RepID=UPI0033A22B05